MLRNEGLSFQGPTLDQEFLLILKLIRKTKQEELSFWISFQNNWNWRFFDSEFKKLIWRLLSKSRNYTRPPLLVLTAVQSSNQFRLWFKEESFSNLFFCKVVGFRRIHRFLRDSRQSVVHGKAMMQMSGRPSSLIEMQMEQHGKGLFQSECVWPSFEQDHWSW
jgi:hypothetical protein